MRGLSAWGHREGATIRERIPHIGRAARIVTAAGSAAFLVAAARVGHSGGELVYRYGAAGAYTGNPGRDTTMSSSAASLARAGTPRGDDDSDRR